MNLFDTNADVEVSQEIDSVGYKAKESGLYPATVKTAYVDTNTETGSSTLVLILNVTPEGQDAFEHTERECIISGKTKGDYYIDKNGKKKQLIGKARMNSLCEMLVGDDLAGMAKAGGVEEKSHKVRRDGKEVVVALPTLTAWQGKELHIGMQKVIENKQVKQGNTYVDTAETRETNVINKFFDSQKRTNLEAKDNAPAEHHVEWCKAYEGKTIDKVKPVAAAKGMPSAAPAQTLNLNI